MTDRMLNTVAVITEIQRLISWQSAVECWQLPLILKSSSSPDFRSVAQKLRGI